MKFIYKSVSLKVGVRAYAGFPGGSMVKNPPANAGDTSLISGLERFPGEGKSNPLQYSWEKAMAPNSSTLAWKIPRMEEPGRLQSMGSLRVRHK